MECGAYLCRGMGEGEGKAIYQRAHPESLGCGHTPHPSIQTGPKNSKRKVTILLETSQSNKAQRPSCGTWLQHKASWHLQQEPK